MQKRFLKYPIVTTLLLGFLLSLAQAQEISTVPPTTPPIANGMTLWNLLVSAGWVLVPMIIISSIVVALVVYNFFWLQKNRVASETFTSLADRLLQEQNLDALLDLCVRRKEMSAHVLSEVINFARKNPGLDVEAWEQIADSQANSHVTRLSQPNQLLMDMGVMAPMIGLLGTVYGILRSFSTLSNDATPMKTMLLAGGVSQALIATAMGLGVGLIAMLFSAYFKTRIQNLISSLENSLSFLLSKTYQCLHLARKGAA